MVITCDRVWINRIRLPILLVVVPSGVSLLNFSDSLVLTHGASHDFRGGVQLSISTAITVRTGTGEYYFPCSADHEQDWQLYPVDPYSAICDDHTYIHTYITKQPIMRIEDRLFDRGWVRSAMATRKCGNIYFRKYFMAVGKFTNIFVLLLISMLGSRILYIIPRLLHIKKMDGPTDSGCSQMSTVRR